MLWSYNALYHAHRCHLVSFSFPFTLPHVRHQMHRSFPVIHQGHTPRQHIPGPVHLLHNIMLRRFIVRPSFLLANHLWFTWCQPVFQTYTHAFSMLLSRFPEMCDVPLRDCCHHSSCCRSRRKPQGPSATHLPLIGRGRTVAAARPVSALSDPCSSFASRVPTPTLT